MTAKKDIFNIKPNYVGVISSIDNELNEYYARQKREYLLKYNLTESHIKTSKPKTALEAWPR
jgi:hypothetical protein